MLMTAVCLTIVYFRFAIAERPQQSSFSTLNLSTAAEGVYYPDSLEPAFRDEHGMRDSRERVPAPGVAIPEVTRLTEGISANLKKLFAAVGVEFRLLRSERSV